LKVVVEMDNPDKAAGDQPKPGADRDHDQDSPRSQWTQHLARCLTSRLDAEEFDSSVRSLYSKYPLPPPVIADIFLRPQPSNYESLDPRIPRYLQVLAQRKLVDMRSILVALYKYSTSHVYGQPAVTEAQQQVPLRWASSYNAEEVMFYRLSKDVRMGNGIRSTGEALLICYLMARWMTMFTTASGVMTQLQNTSFRDEMEAARAAFVMLLLGVCENDYVLRGLSRPSAKGTIPSSCS
jgi:mediator of RNA polymerase II transcription subunit 5